MRVFLSIALKLGLILLAALPCAMTIRADTLAAPEGKPVYVVWRAVGFEKTLSDYYIKSGGHDVSLAIPAFAASQEYAYTGPNPMLIYRKSDNPPSPTPPVPVGSIQFDPQWKQALVFVYPKADGTLGTRTAPNDDIHFKPGCIRTFNLTTEPILLKIGDEEQTVDPVHEIIVSPKAQASLMPIRYALKTKGVWAWRGSNYFSIPQGTRRTVVLIHTDAALFRAIGTDGAASPPTALQVFSFSEQCTSAGKNKGEPSSVSRGSGGSSASKP